MRIKSARIELRVKPETKAAWRECAAAEGLPLSQWLERNNNYELGSYLQMKDREAIRQSIEER